MSEASIRPAVSPWRSVGVWMAIILALSQLLNAGRSALDPAAFATYLGLPLAASTDAALVQVYGLRAAFLGLFALVLIAQRQFVVLKWFALAALIMPVGDLLLTYRAGAPVATVARHAAYILYIAVNYAFLSRLTQEVGPK